jgi:hypothetical protein
MRSLLFVAVVLVAGCGSSGGGTASAPATPPAPPAAKFTNIILTDDENSKAPKDTFSHETPKIIVFFDFENMKNGSKITGVWICEKAENIPADFKIDEASVEVGMLTNSGNFSLSKPTAGWPFGAYRVELQLDGKVLETVKFNIAK